MLAVLSVNPKAQEQMQQQSSILPLIAALNHSTPSVVEDAAKALANIARHGKAFRREIIDSGGVSLRFCTAAVRCMPMFVHRCAQGGASL